MKYFSLNELTRSATAQSLGIDNTPDATAVGNLTALVDKVLDPLRTAYGKPITVTSGYRCPKLNSAVGGVKASHHRYGQAADITAGDVFANAKLFALIHELDLPFCQAIWEKGNDCGPRWIHVSYVATDVRKQTLRTINGIRYFNCNSKGKSV